MIRIVTAHQPNYLPWIGFFSKIKQSDCLIIADTVVMGDKSVFNRNKIRTNNGWVYLTIPIGHKALNRKICDIKLPSDKTWQKNHWQTVYRNYAHTKFFKDYQDFFEELYQRDFTYIWQLNLEIIKYLLKCFNIEVEMLKASEMTIDQNLRSTDFIIALMAGCGADIYLSGPSGRNYLNLKKFPQQNIGLKFFNFQHPVYQQRYPGFEPDMSAIDLLFNMGPHAGDVISASGSLED